METSNVLKLMDGWLFMLGMIIYVGVDYVYHMTIIYFMQKISGKHWVILVYT